MTLNFHSIKNNKFIKYKYHISFCLVKKLRQGIELHLSHPSNRRTRNQAKTCFTSERQCLQIPHYPCLIVYIVSNMAKQPKSILQEYTYDHVFALIFPFPNSYYLRIQVVPYYNLFL